MHHLRGSWLWVSCSSDERGCRFHPEPLLDFSDCGRELRISSCKFKMRKPSVRISCCVSRRALFLVASREILLIPLPVGHLSCSRYVEPYVEGSTADYVHQFLIASGHLDMRYASIEML